MKKMIFCIGLFVTISISTAQEQRATPQEFLDALVEREETIGMMYRDNLNGTLNIRD